ncbi:MAG: ABC transporter ATP-binding protein [Anaerocolumna aminovalerica]|uniref:ABC transporter ATP-binding protein n=1 Tax=Anaerocolumna aminovalerica TaxID=1527 RepID=UPI00280BA382|nr:ABC transporter ATP-binding protein [Anaerocolumna aminovalerica]MDU6264696.1 ABC transporter ATP-binding protein [Anaerocolumna aminovalerica]
MNISNITAGYLGFSLYNINFSIEEGKISALLGLNGTGKTTIIKTISGLLKAKEGHVFIDGKDILTMNEKERGKILSYVPQRSDIVYETSVMDVVLMGVTPYLGLFQTPGMEHKVEALNCLEKLGIKELSDENYQNLSEGQKQLVLIARALLQDGTYMLLDEPDSSLDLVNKHKLMKKIRQIIKDNNKSALISMHNPEYALNYCDKILLLKRGEISEIDLEVEDMVSIEKKLIEIYGPIKILKYDDKYILYYNG